MQDNQPPPKSALKRGSEVLGAIEGSASKKKRIGPHGRGNEIREQYGISSIVERLDRMAAEAKRDRQEITEMLQKVLQEIRRVKRL